jgi:hypothetical protein
VQVVITAKLCLACEVGPLVTIAWHVLGLQMEGRPPAMEGSCEYEYIE